MLFVTMNESVDMLWIMQECLDIIKFRADTQRRIDELNKFYNNAYESHLHLVSGYYKEEEVREHIDRQVRDMACYLKESKECRDSLKESLDKYDSTQELKLKYLGAQAVIVEHSNKVMEW